eukprot:1248705-Ditylum_brightwellii.AAC.1
MPRQAAHAESVYLEGASATSNGALRGIQLPVATYHGIERNVPQLYHSILEEASRGAQGP